MGCRDATHPYEKLYFENPFMPFPTLESHTGYHSFLRSCMHDYQGERPSHEDVSSPRTKRIGGYLVEAGLLTPAQVDVVLNDQKKSGLRFGEILAARGWVKQETVEYFMEKVVLPERSVAQSTLDQTCIEENHKVNTDDTLGRGDR